MAEGGVDSKEYLTYLAEESGNVAADGNFSQPGVPSKYASRCVSFSVAACSKAWHPECISCPGGESLSYILY